MIITIQIDTLKDTSEDIAKIINLINKEKIKLDPLPTISNDDLPDTGIEPALTKPKRKSKITIEDTPQLETILPGAIPPPPPLPGKSEFTQMMLKITPHVVSGLMPMEKVEEFCKKIGCVVKDIGTVAKLQELPHLIPQFLNLVDDHVKSKT